MGEAPSGDSTANANRPEDDLLKVFSSRTNRAVLALLAVEPTYPRKIGNLLSLSEAEVARRLKHMEGLGLVAGAWSYVGKNIKLYRLAVDGVFLRFSAEGLRIELTKGQGPPAQSFVLLPFPVNVPKTDTFFGREPELAALGGPDRVVLVEGMPGIGKTALVANYVRSQAAGTSVFWHSFRGLESLTWLINRLAVFLASHGDRAVLQAIEEGTDVADRRELLLRSLDSERFLIVFDDVHRIEDAAVREFVTDAINRVQKAKLIITGRESPRFNMALPLRRDLRLAGLSDQEVGQFLAHRKIAIARDLLPKVREEVGGHPMALNLLLEAATELQVPLEKLLDRIPERNIEDYLLQEVYGGLSDDEKQTLAMASLFRNTFNVDDLNALAKRNYEHLLLRLRRKLLVQSNGTDYSLHEVIRNFFYKLVKDREALHAKAAANYLSRNTIEGRLEAMHHYVQAGKRDQVLRLLEEDLDLHQFDVIDAGYQNLYFDVLGLFKKADVTDPRRWALIQDEKGDISLHRGDATAALGYYDEALAYFGKANDVVRILDLSWKRALALETLGRVEEARSVVQGALVQGGGEGQARTRLESLAHRLTPEAAPKKARKLKA